MFLIQQIIIMIVLTSFCQLVQGGNTALHARHISQNANHHMSSMINDKDPEVKNGSFSVIVRMMAVGIQRANDEENDEESNKEDERGFLSPSNHGSEEEQVEDVQQNRRLLLLPLMIRMLLERMAQQAKDTRESSQINCTSNTKEFSRNNFYTSLQRFLNTTAAMTEVEKRTIIVFLILSFVALVLMVFSIIRRLRTTDNLNIIRVHSLPINGKETKKLLP